MSVGGDSKFSLSATSSGSPEAKCAKTKTVIVRQTCTVHHMMSLLLYFDSTLSCEKEATQMPCSLPQDRGGAAVSSKRQGAACCSAAIIIIYFRYMKNKLYKQWGNLLPPTLFRICAVSPKKPAEVFPA